MPMNAAVMLQSSMAFPVALQIPEVDCCPSSIHHNLRSWAPSSRAPAMHVKGATVLWLCYMWPASCVAMEASNEVWNVAPSLPEQHSRRACGRNRGCGSMRAAEPSCLPITETSGRLFMHPCQSFVRPTKSRRVDNMERRDSLPQTPFLHDFSTITLAYCASHEKWAELLEGFAAPVLTSRQAMWGVPEAMRRKGSTRFGSGASKRGPAVGGNGTHR